MLAFLLTLGLSFLAILTGALTLFDLSLWGPALAALLITAATRGKVGLKDLLRRLVRWRVSLRWYLVIFFGWPALMLIAAFIHAQLTNQALSFRWNSWSMTLTFLSSAFILAFWASEEIGWRGFALPRLLNRWNTLVSSLILGILWGIWHLPYYLSSQGIDPGLYRLLIFTVSASILMTWVFNHTHGSLFVAVFFHFWINMTSGLQADILPNADPVGLEWTQYLLAAGVAVLVVLVYGYRSLTRKEKGEAMGAGV